MNGSGMFGIAAWCLVAQAPSVSGSESPSWMQGTVSIASLFVAMYFVVLASKYLRELFHKTNGRPSMPSVLVTPSLCMDHVRALAGLEARMGVLEKRIEELSLAQSRSLVRKE